MTIVGPPVAQAITLMLHFVDGTCEDWHFDSSRDARDFILTIQAAKRVGVVDAETEWMADVVKVERRPFGHGAN
jgi:hypothetical protein